MTIMGMFIIHFNRFFYNFSVEDPSEEFVRLRDYVDVVNGLEHVSLFADPEIVKAGFTEDMVKVKRVSNRFYH